VVLVFKLRVDSREAHVTIVVSLSLQNEPLAVPLPHALPSPLFSYAHCSESARVRFLTNAGAPWTWPELWRSGHCLPEEAAILGTAGVWSCWIILGVWLWHVVAWWTIDSSVSPALPHVGFVGVAVVESTPPIPCMASCPFSHVSSAILP
jgi:hypothetical protein